MSAHSEPNVIEYLTLGAAVLAPALAAWTTIWSVKRAERDKFSLHIDWKFDFEHDFGISEIPYLYIQNHTSAKILISSIQWYRGTFRRKMCRATALPWDDPTDLDFPYEIEPGAVRSFAISEEGAKEQFRRATWRPRFWDLIRRSSIWIGVSTVSGEVQFVNGETALAWNDRPDWAKITDDDNHD